MEEKLYVINRFFKSALGQHVVGTILTQEQLEEIRLWPLKLKEAKIIELPSTEKDVEKLADYYLARHGIDLKAILAERASKGSEPAEPLIPVASEPPTPGTPPVGSLKAVTVPNVPAVPVPPVVIKSVPKPLTGK